MDQIAECTRVVSQKYVGYKSFEKKKRLRNEGENIGLSCAELSEDERNAQTEELFRKAPNRYSVERVSGFMDVEGDTTGAGYFDQKFTHDPNLLYNLPPNFPKWSLTDSTDDGCFMDFMMLSYKDHGAILNLGY